MTGTQNMLSIMTITTYIRTFNNIAHSMRIGVNIKAMDNNCLC